MTCDDVERNLESYLGGDAPVEFARHAAGCERCRPLLALVSESRAVFASGRSAPSADLSERAFRAAMAAPPRAPGFLELVLRWAAFATPVAVAAAVLLVVGTTSYDSGTSLDSSTSKIDAASAILGDATSWQAFNGTSGELP